MDRGEIGLICILVVTGILACQSGTITQTSRSTTPIAPTATIPTTNIPTSTPTLIPPLMSYDGEWEGLTKLGLPVSFRVEDNLVTYFAAEYDTQDCHVKVEPDLLGLRYIIENNSFSMGNPYHNFDYAWHFEGIFISSSTASGKLTARMGTCGNVDTTWEASRK
jgi:hypothetical protein